MLEKHSDNPPAGFSNGNEVVEVKAAKPDMSLYAQYAAHWGPGVDIREQLKAAAELAKTKITQPPTPPEPQNPEETLAAITEAVDIDKNAEQIEQIEAAKADEVDPDELAMLGIDPADFAGFGK